jgi:single-stranded DNA-specific DHH superfamily exonuclease
MKPRKPKPSEPSLRNKLSATFLEAFQSDFEANGITVIEALRKESPAKYAEIAARLIAATEPATEKSGIAGAKSMEDVGRRLLQQVGLPEPTDEEIEQAILANDKFLEQLQAICDKAQFAELTNGNAQGELGELN